MTSRSFRVASFTTVPSPVGSPAARGSGGFFGTRSRSRSPSRSPAVSRDEARASRSHRRRDQEAARMTAFPTPGQYSSPASPIQTPRSSGSLTTKQAHRAKDAPRSATMYWMPDHLCKTCYDCGASFNVFRRRHHCRLCGQIFCHNCSNQFVDGTMHGFRHQMIRICKFCARYVSVTTDAEKRHRLSQSNISTISGPPRRATLEDAAVQVPPPAVGTAALPVASPLLFSAVDVAASEPLPADDPMDFVADEFEEEVRAMVAAGDELLAAQSQEEDAQATAAASSAAEEPVPPSSLPSAPSLGSIQSHESVGLSTEKEVDPVVVIAEPQASGSLPVREASSRVLDTQPEPATPLELAPVETSRLLAHQSSESVNLSPATQTLEPTVTKTPSFLPSQSSESVELVTKTETEPSVPVHVETPTPLLTIQSSESVNLSTETPTPNPMQTPPEPTLTLPEPKRVMPAPLATIQSSESLDFSASVAHTQLPPPLLMPKPAPSPQSFRRPSLMRRRRSSLDFLNGDPTVMVASTASTATDNESIASGSDTHADDKVVPYLDHEADSFRVRTKFHTQREIVLDKYMTAAHERIREGIQHSVDRSMKHFVGDPVEVKRLVTSLEDMAYIVTGHLLFSMNFRTPNGFNFAGLVNVKSIATPTAPAPSSPSVATGQGDPYSFKWLAGCVCRKQLSHKQMARKIENPRILLLACAISYDRTAGGANKLSSLDALIDSEKSYMGILVDKISKLEPDIVFVEHTVSRHAQELLRERGIAIVLNVKHATLERIARFTGATVLPSVDHVDQVVPNDVIGKCRSFYAQSVPVVTDDPLATPPNGEVNGTAPGSSSTGVSLQRMGSTRPKTETYLYLDGCDPLNGCTVLITGPSKKKLRTMKTLTQSVLMMTYRTLLEAHVLSGLGLGFTDWYRRSVADHQDRAAWCTTCTLRQFETVDGELRYFQCSGSKQIGITPYSKDDISLGNFLAKEMNALGYRCHNPKCSFTMVDHVQTFNCTMGTVTVSFEELPDATNDESLAGGDDPNSSYFNVLSLLGNSDTVAATGSSPTKAGASIADDDDPQCPTIVYGKWCSECSAMICPFTPLKKYAYKFSLARLLEVLLLECYPQSPALDDIDTSAVTAIPCKHDFMKSHVLFFNVGRIVARMDFTPRKPLRLFNTPTFVVVNGRRRLCTSAVGVRSRPASETETVDPIGMAASRRAVALSTLLDSVVDLFEERIGSLQEVVLTCDDQDGATHVLIEVAQAKKRVADDAEEFAQRLAAMDEGDATVRKRLADTDRAKRDLYQMVCDWIELTQKLRKLLRSTLAIEPESTPSVAASSFSLPGFGFSTPTTQSPVLSPSTASGSGTRQTRAESKSAMTAPSIDERSRASSVAQSFNSVSEMNELFTTSSPKAAIPSPRVVKSTSAPVPSSQFSTQFSTVSTKSETKEVGWKSMLWDIYRAAGGRSSPGDDLELPLPAELFEGHPSLPHRSDKDDCVFLVSETEPITYVAYALASQSYDDQIAAWKAAVQPQEVRDATADAVDAEAAIELSSSAAEKEWTRAALSTTMQVHFKDNITDTPKHLSLLYPSGSNASGCWDFSTIAFFPLQFEALREMFYGSRADFLFSISHVNNWAALGGKSGASFYRTLDNRFVVKHISLTEQQSFLDVLPSYFDYMSKIYHDETPSVISKTIGMYQTTITKKDTGQRTTYHIVVMENAFYGHDISKTFDLKGSLRNRFVKPDADGKPRGVELDGNFVEMTAGHPMGVIAEDHELLLSAIMNDSAFLTSINIVDFSLVLGLGGETPDMPTAYTHMVVGIIDYLRQFDLMKRVESVSKSVAMIAGQSSPTIIEPALYSKRFSDAIKRYFMPVTPIDSNRNDPYIPPSN